MIASADAEVIVMLGAVMAGRSLRLQEQLPVPVLDGVRCGIPLLEALVRVGAKRPVSGSYAALRDRDSIGLPDALARRLRGEET